MIVPKLYFGTAFTRADIVRLQEMLGLKKSEAIQAAMMITGQLYACQISEDARQRVPDPRAAERRLDRIATTAGVLARLLEEEPAAETLVRVPGSMLTREDCKDEDGVVCLGTMRDIDQKKVLEFIETARIISNSAEIYAKDGTNFRALHMLLPVRHAGKSPISLFLWPELFKIWLWSGKRLAKTANGPLHRFVNFVHQASGIAKVSASTLKDAVIAFEQDRAATVLGKDPPWREPDED